MMNAWIIKPTITVTMNNASLLSSSPISSMLATRCAIRLQIPTGAYLQTTTEKKMRYKSIIFYYVIIIIIILFKKFKLNKFLNLHNPHVAMLIKAGCITYNKIQKNISLLKSGKYINIIHGYINIFTNSQDLHEKSKNL